MAAAGARPGARGVALLGYANLTRFVLRVLDIRMRLYEVLSITVGSLAVSHVLSAGGVGGWVVTYNALRRREVPHGLVFVAIAAQQFFNYIVLWLLFGLAPSCTWWWRRGESAFSYLVAIILIGLLLWLTAYGVYLYNHRTKMRRRVAQIAHLVNRVTRRQTIKEEHIDDWLDNLFAGMRRMTSHPGAFRRTFLYACGYWFFDLLCLYVTFLAFDYGSAFTALLDQLHRRLRGRDPGADAGRPGRRRGPHDRALRGVRRAVGDGRRRRAHLSADQLLAADPARARELRRAPLSGLGKRRGRGARGRADGGWPRRSARREPAGPVSW